MTRTIGLLATDHISAGLVENNQLAGPVRRYPERAGRANPLANMPAQELVEAIAQQIVTAAEGQELAAIGVGFPGIIRDGVVEDSPNLQQTKGQKLRVELSALLGARGVSAPVQIIHDADALAAGIAASLDHLDKVIRVWTLFGDGVGFGRYPQPEGYWEGGHAVVTLDPKEKFCGRGGVGHLEGIMGNAALRRRFLDLEPEEVFAQARAGDERCLAFVKLYHRALAAATATSVHMDGPGKFFISGPNAQYVQVHLLESYLSEMVKMSPLQGSQLEIAAITDDMPIIGAALSAARMATTS